MSKGVREPCCLITVEGDGLILPLSERAHTHTHTYTHV